MPIAERKDAQGYHWIVPADQESASVDAWWSRNNIKLKRGKTRVEEHLCVMQTQKNGSSDVIMLAPGQVYDLIHALNRAVEKW